MKVLYLSGMGRSGSTILDSVLGQLGGAVSGGELCFLWDRGVESNTLCSCGRWFDECDFWREVMALVLRDYGGQIPAQAGSFFATHGKNTVLPKLLTALRRDKSSKSLIEYGRLLRVLYSSIARVSSARLIVDSSKFPGYASILSRFAGLDVYRIHLIRDSRGVAYSWSKKKQYYNHEGETEYMPRYGPLAVSARWYAYNVGTELCAALDSRPCLRVRYEDFVRDPRSVLAETCEFCEEPLPPGLLAESHEIVPGDQHIISGNPTRFVTGKQTIRADDAWVRDMNPVAKTLVTVCTGPLLARYKYWSRSEPR